MDYESGTSITAGARRDRTVGSGGMHLLVVARVRVEGESPITNFHELT